MAHWAKLDENNLVIEIIVTNNNDPAGDEGYAWLVKNLGGTWIKTSYNTMGGIHLTGGTPLRKNYAGIGFTYDQNRDAFIPPNTFDSWVLNEDTCLWEPPIPKPNDAHQWNEALLTWELKNPPAPSWTYDESEGDFVAPIAKPNDGKKYEWDESLVNWIQVQGE